MVDFTEVAALVPTLRSRIGACASAVHAQTVIAAMTDADAEAVLREADSIVQIGEQLKLLSTGVLAARSSRDAGHVGAAQKRGHRNAVSLIQQLTGVTKAEAARQVRVGEAMLGGADAPLPAGATTDAPPPPPDWRAPLRDARRHSLISTAQFDAIQRGLGEPPTAGADLDEQDRRDLDEATRDAWARAAEQLILEAPERTVEELSAAARGIRDLLDPDGAEARFLARHERRCYRSWIDQDGVRRATIVYDDEGGALMDTIFNAALRPRRGGPRFVDSEEQAKADALADDPRTNDQLGYDLLLDLVRAGALADAKEVFGTRQAGVRLVQVVDTDGMPAPIGHTEDGLAALPTAAIEQHICQSGTVAVTVDGLGNPLDVGREQRFFTPRQRVALAIRDGGCRWRGCDRPASYCEAHHIDEWARDGGRTDIDRGILLCRYHHMQLHHGGWRVVRDGDDFALHDPGGGVRALRTRALLAYAWGGMDPPAKRFRPMVA